MSTDETDHLFTPEPFVDLKARNLRKRKPAPPKPEPPPNLIVSDGSWVAMARQGQVPHPYAHLLRPGSAYGVATTACGSTVSGPSRSRRTAPYACPVCAGLPVHQVATSKAKWKRA